MARVTVPSLAKLNQDLRVLHKRRDGYHELRTIFQTVSLRDTLTIDFEPGKRGSIELNSSADIPDNLVLRAAHLAADELKIRANLRIWLKKKIPMGAGLGGGSSNAAAVLIALTALAGKQVPLSELVRLGEQLGSDVPFFLYGGTALGLGRGTELYPLPDQPPRSALIISTGVHVSTAEAYRVLGREAQDEENHNVTNALTSSREFPILREFQVVAWNLNESDLHQLSLVNDFEKPVFKTHRELAAVARKLRRWGARPALMTGSGSAIFGVFQAENELKAATAQFPPGTAFPVSFVSRRQYRSLWRRALGPAAAASCFARY
jgi:4-diphosphocytidyl-2-C-methyl-D-erythritol kinase